MIKSYLVEAVKCFVKLVLLLKIIHIILTSGLRVKKRKGIKLFFFKIILHKK